MPNKFVSLDGFKLLEFSDLYHTHVTTQIITPSLCHFSLINTALNGFQLGNTTPPIITYSENDTHKLHAITLQEKDTSMFCSKNTTLPSTAIMGGSITATLRAWNDTNFH